MSENVEVTALAGAVVHQFPGASTVRGQTLLRDAAAAYVIEERARDTSRASRIRWWVEKLGHVPLADLDSDDISDLLDAYKSGAAQKYRRGSEYVEGLPRSNGTVNRLRSALGGLLKWAKRRRLTPKGWTNPVRDTEHRREARHRVRFVSEDEAVAQGRTESSSFASQ